MASNYEIGEAAGMEKGMKACRVLLDKLVAAKRDSDEWKEQHENLLAMYRAAERDAARYRFLRNPRRLHLITVEQFGTVRSTLHSEALDKAVDEAMASHPSTTGEGRG